MSRDGVLVVGSANMDLVVRVERFPLPGETLFGTGFKTFPGGKGANQAVCCAKLGQKVQFVGRMGNDFFRDRLCASMRQDGVMLDSLTVDSTEPTGTALITVDRNGQNEILVVSGSNMKLRPEDVDGVHDLFGSAAVVLVQLEIPLETVIRTAELAHEQQALLILNPAPACSLPPSLLRLVDYLTPNESEAQMLTGIPVTRRSSAEAAAKKLVDQGVKNVLLTLGPEGCLLVNCVPHAALPRLPCAPHRHDGGRRRVQRCAGIRAFPEMKGSTRPSVCQYGCRLFSDEAWRAELHAVDD